MAANASLAPTYLNIRRLGKIVPAPSRPRWRFGPDARDQLLRILGPRPGLIEQLEHDVAPAGHCSGPEAERRWDQDRSRRFDQYQRLCRDVHALRRILAALDWVAGEDVEGGGDGEYASDNNRDDPDLDLVWLDDALEELEKVARWLVVARKRKRPGRPKGVYALRRRMLTHSVGMTLDRAGVELTRGREGALARTLAVVLDSAGFAVPEDIFPIVRQVVASVGRVKERVAARETAGLVTPTKKTV